MNFKQTFIAVVLGATAMFAASTGIQDANAGPGLTLSESVKSKLIAAEPVLGKKVFKETFDGKPVMVTFFASW